MPLLYTNALYGLIFVCALLACTLSELLGAAGPWRRPAHATTRLDRGSLPLLNSAALVGMILALLLPLVLPATTIRWQQPVLFLSGLMLLGLGMGIRRYTMAVLGRFFVGKVQVHDDQPVIQEGPYRVVRHPAYSGMLLAALGVGLMTTNWASLLSLMLGLLIGLVYRIQVEEAALLQMRGQQYRAYMQRTKRRLIPYVF